MAQRAAELHTHPSLMSSTPARAIGLDLAPLISPYRRRGRFTLRIENLPQGARFTAGRNNGDRTWSLALDELDELFYVPPDSLVEDHALALRLIAKEEGNASTLALIELPIRAGALAVLSPSSPPVSVMATATAPRPDTSHGEALSKEISSLKAELAGREQELNQMRAATQSLNGDWQAKFETAIAAAKSEWGDTEASRLAAAKADHEKEASALRELETHVAQANTLLVQREGELAALKAEALRDAAAKADHEKEVSALRELETHVAQANTLLVQREGELAALKAEALRDAAAKADHEKEASALRELKTHVAQANTLLVQREDELAALKAELTLHRQASTAEISAARTALEVHSARDAQRREQSAQALLELKDRCDQAEGNLARQRQASEAEIATAKHALAAQGVLELDKQEQAAQALADLTVRCNQAEAKLSQQHQALENEIVAARKTAEEQDATEAEREREAARALAELQARCEAAEAELRAAQLAGETAAADDAYVRGLNQEIKNLQAVLVDREAAIARAEASLDLMQLGVVAKPAPAHWEPLPGGFTKTGKDEAKKSDGHLARDFLLVFAVVMIGCLAYFFGPPLIANWRSLDLGNLFASGDADQDDASSSAPAAPAPPPKPKLPVATVVRDVNLRAAPSASADVITALKQGSAVTVLERQGNWDHVEVVISGQESRQGWAYGGYLAETDKASP